MRRIWLALTMSLLMFGCDTTEYLVVDDGVGEPGPHPVALAPIPGARARLFYPLAEAGAPGPVTTALPLVVLMAGFASETTAYDGTSAHLASHGYAVLAVEHDYGFGQALVCQTQADGLGRAVDVIASSLDFLSSANAGVLEGVVDGSALVTVGHSYGGKLAFWIALEDERVKGVFTLDPVDGGDEGRRPAYCPSAPEGFPAIAPRTDELSAIPLVAVQAGKAGDCAPVEGNASVFIGAAAGAARNILLPGAGHADFIDDALEEECAGCDFCPGSEVEASEVQRLVRGALRTFVSEVLLDEASPAESIDAVDAWLLDADFEPEFVVLEP